MLTFEDCTEFLDVLPEEISAIAHHEHIPDMVALERVADLLDKEWGPCALRQMVLDELHLACAHKRPMDVKRLQVLYVKTMEAHPGGTDRRTFPRKHQ